MWGLLGYAIIEYNQFQIAMHRNQLTEKLPFNWSKILIIKTLNIIASVLIYFGIKNSEKLHKKSILLVWLPTLFLVPITLFFIKLAVLTGFWFGG